MLTEAPKGFMRREDPEFTTNGGAVHAPLETVALAPTIAEPEPFNFQYPTGDDPLTNAVYVKSVPFCFNYSIRR